MDLEGSLPHSQVNLQYDPYRSRDTSTGATVNTELTDGHGTINIESYIYLRTNSGFHLHVILYALKIDVFH
jgi:hypothetical protein